VKRAATAEPVIMSRKLQTKAGEVWLKVPKLRQQTFETTTRRPSTIG
jgi:transposase-like protein